MRRTTAGLPWHGWIRTKRPILGTKAERTALDVAAPGVQYFSFSGGALLDNAQIDAPKMEQPACPEGAIVVSFAEDDVLGWIGQRKSSWICSRAKATSEPAVRCDRRLPSFSANR